MSSHHEKAIRFNQNITETLSVCFSSLMKPKRKGIQQDQANYTSTGEVDLPVPEHLMQSSKEVQKISTGRPIESIIVGKKKTSRLLRDWVESLKKLPEDGSSHGVS